MEGVVEGECKAARGRAGRRCARSAAHKAHQQVHFTVNSLKKFFTFLTIFITIFSLSHRVLVCVCVCMCACVCVLVCVWACDPHLLTFSGSFQQQCQRPCVMLSILLARERELEEEGQRKGHWEREAAHYVYNNFFVFCLFIYLFNLRLSSFFLPRLFILFVCVLCWL